MVPLTFTNYDNACLGTTATVPHAVCQLLMGHAYDKARASPWEETTPCVWSASSSEQTLPRLSPASATCSPRMPQKATPLTVSYTA
jgi:hypothetical protein